MNERICPTCFGYMYLSELKGWIKCPACSFMKKEAASMITLKELLGDNKQSDLNPELLNNANDLLIRLNKFRAEYGIPMIVNSGYRTEAHNAEIGGAKNSSHCHCQAADFKDNDGLIKKFIEKDPDILIRCDLYQEDPEATKTWVHLQSRAIPSGKRIFKS